TAGAAIHCLTSEGRTPAMGRWPNVGSTCTARMMSRLSFVGRAVGLRVRPPTGVVAESSPAGGRIPRTLTGRALEAGLPAVVSSSCHDEAADGERRSSAAVAGVGGPVGLEEVPLFGRSPDQAL